VKKTKTRPKQQAELKFTIIESKRPRLVWSELSPAERQQFLDTKLSPEDEAFLKGVTQGKLRPRAIEFPFSDLDLALSG
jgi:hypothetical protein